MNPTLRTRLQAGVLFLIFAVLAFPAGTLEHELGHYAVVRSMGFDARLTYGSVQEEGELSPDQWTLYAAAGPLATWAFALAAFAALLIAHRHGAWKHVKGVPVAQAALSLAALFVLRNVLAGFYFFRSGLEAGAGDERIVADNLGLSLTSLVSIEFLVSMAVMVGVFWLVRRGCRVWAMAGTVAGLYLGGYIWYGALGPILLPAA